MPPKKATAAQKGKSTAPGETSQVRRVTRARAQPELETVPPTASSATPPVSEGIRAVPVADQRAASPPVVGAPAPQPLAPQPGAEDRAMREAVQLLTRWVAAQEQLL
ncbi:arabinogalactan protein 1-like [Lycium ferocissimum]|uniref:arabinogalactan protein 1-like n=1 Tax=Lycium ferocissimum TaxID=112874 RepID=UPI002815291B|nr:arabinogalactan protein 1-like [Lycium ferocissimum]